MNTSKKLRELRQEAQALKLAFAQAATKLSLFSKEFTFSTSENIQTTGGITVSGQERVVVTLTTRVGANTIAKLEVSGDYATVPIVRRVPFSGGARWVVTAPPKLSGGNWQATNYRFVVQSLVNGTLSARMIWQ